MDTIITDIPIVDSGAGEMGFLGLKITNQFGETKEEARVNSRRRIESKKARDFEVTKFYWNVWDDPSHEYHQIVWRPTIMKKMMFKHHPEKIFGHMRNTREDGNHTYGKIVPKNSTEYLQSNGLLVEKMNDRTNETEWVKQKNGPDINLLSKPVLIVLLILMLVSTVAGMLMEIMLVIAEPESAGDVSLLYGSVHLILMIVLILWLTTDLLSRKKPQIRPEDRY